MLVTESTPASAEATTTTPNEVLPQTTPEVAPETVVTDPSVPSAPESKEDARLAAKFAALSRKERDLRKGEQDLKRMQKELEEARKAADTLMQKKSKAKEDPLAWLKEADLDYDEITSHMLKQPNPQETKMSKLEKELEQMKIELANRDALTQQQEAQKEIDTFKTEISEFVDAMPDKYELIITKGAQEVVYNVILEELSKSGNILSFDEACNLVENHLQQEVEADVKRLQQTKKVGSLFAAAKAAVQQSTSAPATKPENKTLTNTPDSPTIVDREMTPHERLKEAAKLLNFGNS